MRVFAGVWGTVFGLDGHGVLGLVGSDLSVFVGILGEVDIGGVGNSDSLAFLHGGEGIVEATDRTVVGVAAAVARDPYVVVEDESVARDDVLDVDVGHIARRVYRDGVVELTGCLVKGRRLIGIGLTGLRLGEDDVALDRIVELNVCHGSIEGGVVGETEAHVRG